MIAQFFIAVIAIASLLFVVDILANRHPLTEEEVQKLLRKRQWEKGLMLHSFSSRPILAHPEEKKRMKSGGEWLEFHEKFDLVPARMAGFLKYKKHEWVILVVVQSHNSLCLWWNKGPNNATVAPNLPIESIISVAQSKNADLVARLHNHPNSNPSLYDCTKPSGQDLRSAEYIARSLSQSGISMLDFVCERGFPYLYYAHFTDKAIPPTTMLHDIQCKNGTGMFGNYSLRCELRKKPRKYRSVVNSRNL